MQFQFLTKDKWIKIGIGIWIFYPGLRSPEYLVKQLAAYVFRFWIMVGECSQKSKNDTLRQLSNVASEISIKKLAMALGRK